MDNDSPPRSFSFSQLWSELKHRKVFRVATVYAVVAWLIIQIASATFDGFGIPDWAFRFVVIMLLLGFPVALVLTWAFELTPDGIKKTKVAREEHGDAPVSKKQERKRNWMLFAFAAGVPTLIFGTLAVFFFLRSVDSASTAPTSEADSVVEGQSIAMMPLTNMSSNEENAYFAGGIHEDVLTNLSRVKNLKVFSRTSMLRYAASEKTLQEIGRELGLDYIVEGSVRRIGNHVRVTVQLINARNDLHLWASNYERELVDVFATQSEIAREISNSIHLELQPDTVGTLVNGVMPTVSVKAYDLYLRSLSIEKTEGETEESMTQRRDMLELAVKEDADFVEAWANLSRIYYIMASRTTGRGWYLEGVEDARSKIKELETAAQRALAKAVALDPKNPETRLSQAVDHIWPQPSEEMAKRKAIFDSLIAEDPNNAKAWYHLAWWHRHTEPSDIAAGFVAFEKALALDPFNARIVRALLESYRSNGDQKNVTRLAERLTQIIPETADDRHLARISANSRLNRLIDLFVATADPSIIAEFKGIHNNAVQEGGFESQESSDAWDCLLAILENQTSRIATHGESVLVADKSLWQNSNG